MERAEEAAPPSQLELDNREKDRLVEAAILDNVAKGLDLSAPQEGVDTFARVFAQIAPVIGSPVSLMHYRVNNDKLRYGDLISQRFIYDEARATCWWHSADGVIQPVARTVMKESYMPFKIDVLTPSKTIDLDIASTTKLTPAPGREWLVPDPKVVVDAVPSGWTSSEWLKNMEKQGECLKLKTLYEYMRRPENAKKPIPLTLQTVKLWDVYYASAFFNKASEVRPFNENVPLFDHQPPKKGEGWSRDPEDPTRAYLFGGYPKEMLSMDRFEEILKGDSEVFDDALYILQLVYETFCDKRQDLYEWFMANLTIQFLYPCYKSGKFLFLVGPQGAGKTTLAKFLFCYLIGNHITNFTTSLDQSGFGAKFLAPNANKRVNLVDEVDLSGLRSEIFNGVVTNTEQTHELKFGNSIKCYEPVNFVSTTNHVPYCLNQDRRKVIYMCKESPNLDNVRVFRIIEDPLHRVEDLLRMVCSGWLLLKKGHSFHKEFFKRGGHEHLNWMSAETHVSLQKENRGIRFHWTNRVFKEAINIPVLHKYVVGAEPCNLTLFQVSPFTGGFLMGWCKTLNNLTMRVLLEKCFQVLQLDTSQQKSAASRQPHAQAVSPFKRFKFALPSHQINEPQRLSDSEWLFREVVVVPSATGRNACEPVVLEYKWKDDPQDEAAMCPISLDSILYAVQQHMNAPTTTPKAKIFQNQRGLVDIHRIQQDIEQFFIYQTPNLRNSEATQWLKFSQLEADQFICPSQKAQWSGVPLFGQRAAVHLPGPRAFFQFVATLVCTEITGETLPCIY